ncbi:MAG: glycerophosphodiester phosphodiesterase family protein [Pseudomonadota bacterium]
MLADTLAAFRIAIRLLLPLFSVHIFVRLVVAAILVPSIGALLAFTLSFSDQAALTDQDIAKFLLTPAGAIGMLAVASLVLAAAVVDVAAMTSVLRSAENSPARALKAAAGFLASALPRLALFAVHFLLRVLVLTLPFLAISGVAALVLLGEFDINYYLSFRPPEFMTTVAIGAVCALVLMLVLLERLSAWAIAMHLVVFDMQHPANAFRLSRDSMRGQRLTLILRLLTWFGIRFVLASLVVAIFGFLLAEGPPFFDENLRLFFTVTAVLLGIWLLVNTSVNAVSNGALAEILNEEFDRYLDMGRAQGEFKSRAQTRAWLPLAVTAIALVSLIVSGVAFNGVGGVEKVDVIGHRGAAASRPENTMAAVVKAVEDGADWVEIDVQESAEGDVIVVHDSDFMKAAGVATKVWDVTAEELSGIDIGSWFDPAYASERTPTLRDVLQAVKGRSRLIIELKYYGHDVDLENRVIALVEEAGMADQIATMSLKYPAVQKMISLRPDWRTGVLAATSVGNLAELEGDFLAVSTSRISGRLIRQAHGAGKDVYVWTVNDAATMSRMISMGVDGLITDKPDLARLILDEYAALSTPQRVMLRLGDVVGVAFDILPDEEPSI